MGERIGLFLGVGFDSPPGRVVLAKAESDVADVRGVLGDALSAPVPPGRSAEALRRWLTTLGGGEHHQPVVVLWAGHSEPDGGELVLLCGEVEEGGDVGLPLSEVVKRVAKLQPSQLLVVVDVCHAGTGAADAVARAERVLEENPPDAERQWIGVLTSAGGEKARDGLFGVELVRLLREGPREPDLRRRWSRHAPYLRGDDLCDALVKEWPTTGPHRQQRPQFRAEGNAWWMLPNPLYEPDAPAQVVEHLLNAARGGTGDRSWFTGRVAEVGTVVGWVRDPRPGVCVVTGGAGTGKSAILGRVVSLSVPLERDRLLAESEGVLPHADPGAVSIAAHVHARGRTANQLARLLDEQLCTVPAGVDPPAAGGAPVLEHDPGGPRNANLLVGALERRAEAGGVTPVLAIDGLDEARALAGEVVLDLVTRLRASACVIVSTRPVQLAAGGVLELLEPREVLDLDAAESVASGAVDVDAYLERRIGEVRGAKTAEALVARLRERSGPEELPFLFARLVADAVTTTARGSGPGGARAPESAAESAGESAGEPDGESAGEPDPELPSSVGEVLSRWIAAVPAPTHVTLPDGVSPGAWARVLLESLAWGYGSGLPEDEWLLVAREAALRLPVTASASAPVPTREDVTWILGRLGALVLQDGEHGVATYRLAHQTLADELGGASLLGPDPRSVVGRALGERLVGLLRSGERARQRPYFWWYGWRHCADAGALGLRVLRAAVALDAELAPDVPLALRVLAERRAVEGALESAVTLVRSAVREYEALEGDSEPASAAAAQARSDLASRLWDARRHEESLEQSRLTADALAALATADADHLPALVGELTILSDRLAALGRRADALTPAREAVSASRAIPAPTAAHRAALAHALVSLGERLADAGRESDGVAAVTAAVATLTSLVAQGHDHRLTLADAEHRLGDLLAETGEADAALAATLRAEGLLRELTAETGLYRGDLADVLTGVSARLRAAGRLPEARAAAAEALDLVDGVSEGDLTAMTHRALAVAALGRCEVAEGTHRDAVAHLQSAVDLLHDVVEADPASVPELADTLRALSATWLAVGNGYSSVDPADEAARLLGDAVGDSPGFRPELADSLAQLAESLAAVGRNVDALGAAREVVRLRRALAGERGGSPAETAAALTLLGERLSGVGRDEEALEVARESLGLVPPDDAALAAAEHVLAARLHNVRRYPEALEVVTSAVQRRRRLAAADPVEEPALAASLEGLAHITTALGGPATEAWREAVEVWRAAASRDVSQCHRLVQALETWSASAAAAGAGTEAAAHAREALDLLLEPGFAGGALDVEQLCRVLSSLGRYQDAAAEWDRAVAAVTGASRALVLVSRATVAQPQDPAVAGWLVAALGEPDLGAVLVGRIRDVALARRSTDVGFEARWREHEPLPPWFTLDPGLVALAHDWAFTASYRDERDMLLAHPELLGATEEIEEALRRIRDDHAEWMRTRLAECRAQGIAEAYAERVREELVGRLTDANRRRDALEQGGDELADPELYARLRDLADAGDDSALLALALLALLALACESGDALGLALDVVERSAAPDALLDRTAAESPRATIAGAICAWYPRSGPEVEARSRVHTAAALLEDGAGAQARREVRAARRLTDQAGLSALVLRLGEARPSAYRLFELVATPTPRRAAQSAGDRRHWFTGEIPTKEVQT